MSSYVYMKVLESSPERYDRGIDLLSGGAVASIHDRVASLVAAPGRRILDIGCGTGGLSLACAACGAEVVGIDRNPGMLDIARHKLAGRALAGRVELVELGAMEIEDRFAAESFDAVVASLVFSELLPEERTYVLGTVRRLLRRGGLLVIADEVRPRGRARHAWYRLRRLPAAAWTYLLTQATTHPVDGLAGLMRDAGFADVTEERLGGDCFAIVSGRRIEPGS